MLAAKRLIRPDIGLTLMMQFVSVVDLLLVFRRLLLTAEGSGRPPIPTTAKLLGHGNEICFVPSFSEDIHHPQPLVHPR